MVKGIEPRCATRNIAGQQWDLNGYGWQNVFKKQTNTSGSTIQALNEHQW